MKNIFLIFFLFFNVCLVAQDAHFSQFFTSPLTLNPANTGNFNGTLRAASNFRSQMPDFQNAFATKTLSIDAPVFQNYIPPNDKLSVGLLILSDQTGNKLLNNNNVALSLAYSKALDEKGSHSISVGFQYNYSIYRFDFSKANFEDELTPSGFTLSSSELLLENNFTKRKSDFNTGLLYKGSTSENNLFYLGASYYHLLKPSIGFITSTYFTDPRINFHGGSYFSISESTSIHSSFQYQIQDNIHQLVLGSALGYHLDSGSGYDFYAGLWYRNKFSLIPYLGVEWNQLRAGISYDLPVSKELTNSNFYQSSEFSLIYILGGKKENSYLICPKF